MMSEELQQRLHQQQQQQQKQHQHPHPLFLPVSDGAGAKVEAKNTNKNNDSSSNTRLLHMLRQRSNKISKQQQHHGLKKSFHRDEYNEEISSGQNLSNNNLDLMENSDYDDDGSSNKSINQNNDNQARQVQRRQSRRQRRPLQPPEVIIAPAAAAATATAPSPSPSPPRPPVRLDDDAASTRRSNNINRQAHSLSLLSSPPHRVVGTSLLPKFIRTNGNNNTNTDGHQLTTHVSRPSIGGSFGIAQNSDSPPASPRRTNSIIHASPTSPSFLNVPVVTRGSRRKFNSPDEIARTRRISDASHYSTSDFHVPARHQSLLSLASRSAAALHHTTVNSHDEPSTVVHHSPTAPSAAATPSEHFPALIAKPSLHPKPSSSATNPLLLNQNKFSFDFHQHDVKGANSSAQEQEQHVISASVVENHEHEQQKTPVLTDKFPKHLHSLFQRYAERTRQLRIDVVDQPPTPSSSGHSTPTRDSHSEVIDEQEKARRQQAKQVEFRKRLESLAGEMRKPPPGDKNAVPVTDTVELWGGRQWKPPVWLEKFYPRPFSVQTNSKFISWLAVVSVAFLYNAFAVPLRTMFDYDAKVPLYVWLTLDLISDSINLIDLVLVKPLVKVHAHGILITKRRESFLAYVRSSLFIADLLAVVPVDYVAWAMGLSHAKVYELLRINRLSKYSTFTEFFDRVDAVSSVPNAIRILKTMLYMLFLMHCNASIYYVVSRYETNHGVTNIWTYTGKEIAYVRCFFFALKTGSDIGNNDPPFSVLERFYMTCCWLTGVFVFASLIGQIHGIVENMHEREENYRHKMNNTIKYLQKMKIPANTQRRVRHWFLYNWHFQKTLDENEFIEILPHKLKTDVALTVHYETLAKVQLFHDCETGLVRDLVLKLRPRLYLPGDNICKKGEVGHEMFIIKYGYVEVVGGPNNSIVFVTLGEGTVFGEIALLAVGGGNRRTADVRSKGISQLFVLSKHDLEATIVDYPIAQRVLHKKAKALIQESLKHHHAHGTGSGGGGGAGGASDTSGGGDSDTTIQAPARTAPKMAELVLQLLPATSELRRRLSNLSHLSSVSQQQRYDSITSLNAPPDERAYRSKKDAEIISNPDDNVLHKRNFRHSPSSSSTLAHGLLTMPHQASFESDYEVEHLHVPAAASAVAAERCDHDDDAALHADDESAKEKNVTKRKKKSSATLVALLDEVEKNWDQPNRNDHAIKQQASTSGPPYAISPSSSAKPTAAIYPV